MAKAKYSFNEARKEWYTLVYDGTLTATAQKWMLGATGGTISVLIVATAIYMIVVGTKKLKELKTEVKNGQ